MADLHADVVEGNLDVLDKVTLRPLPWQQARSAAEAEGHARSPSSAWPACSPRPRMFAATGRTSASASTPSAKCRAERWRIEDFYSEDRLARDRVYSNWGGFLDKVIFDPVKWHIPPASLRHIEPMQLLSLEVAWQAMARSPATIPLNGIRIPRASGRACCSPCRVRTNLGTAYCFRTMMRHYLPKVEGLAPEVREQIYASLEKQLPEWTEDSFPGFLGNVVAGRIAREFDFNGPNFTVDAACAASLAALFTAVEQLRSGTSDLMLVGGADGTNNPFGYMSFAKTHALSPRGRSPLVRRQRRRHRPGRRHRLRRAETARQMPSATATRFTPSSRASAAPATARTAV